MTDAPALGDELFDLARMALADLTYQQRRSYELVHGLTQHGTTEPLSERQAADQLGIAKSTMLFHLHAAEKAVWRHIAMHYFDAERSRREDHALPTHVAIPAQEDLHSRRSTHANGYTILGDRSERVIREAKRSTERGRRFHMERAQQEALTHD